MTRIPTLARWLMASAIPLVLSAPASAQSEPIVPTPGPPVSEAPPAPGTPGIPTDGATVGGTTIVEPKDGKPGVDVGGASLTDKKTGAMPADLPAVPPETKDMKVYANAAATGDLYEIEAARIAMERSQNEQVKQLATMIQTDHNAASTELKTIVTGKNGSLPTELDAKHAALIDALEDAEDDQFDKTYVDQQVNAHKEALALHQFYAANGDDADLKAFAQKVSPKIQAHLDHAMAMQTTP